MNVCLWRHLHWVHSLNDCFIANCPGHRADLRLLHTVSVVWGELLTTAQRAAVQWEAAQQWFLVVWEGMPGRWRWQTLWHSLTGKKVVPDPKAALCFRFAQLHFYILHFFCKLRVNNWQIRCLFSDCSYMSNGIFCLGRFIGVSHHLVAPKIVDSNI